MYPSHLSASELNKLHDDPIKDINITRELLPKLATSIGTSTTGLTVRRHKALNLPPLDVNLTPKDQSDGAPSTTLTIYKSTKTMHIGFSDLSYTVKTGLWKRSKS